MDLMDLVRATVWGQGNARGSTRTNRMGYTVKHRGGGKYGVVDEMGNPVNEFLGSKTEAEAEAERLNRTE